MLWGSEGVKGSRHGTRLRCISCAPPTAALLESVIALAVAVAAAVAVVAVVAVVDGGRRGEEQVGVGQAELIQRVGGGWRRSFVAGDD